MVVPRELAVGRVALIAIGELDLGSARVESEIGLKGGLVDGDDTVAGGCVAEGANEEKGRCRA